MYLYSKVHWNWPKSEKSNLAQHWILNKILNKQTQSFYFLEIQQTILPSQLIFTYLLLFTINILGLSSTLSLPISLLLFNFQLEM